MSKSVTCRPVGRSTRIWRQAATECSHKRTTGVNTDIEATAEEGIATE
jgi:hypothetical protein